MSALRGIDVSRWQPRMDWPEVRAAGNEYAVARASLGLTPDPEFAMHTNGARKAGLLVGAYHYLWPSIDPFLSVSMFLAAMGNDPTGWACALDLEERGTTWGQAKRWARAFRKAAPGHPIGIYINPSDFHRIGSPPLSEEFDWLWLAYWPTGGYPGDSDATWSRRYGGLKPTLWQYGATRATAASGAVIRVDGNAYLGTREQFAAQLCNPPTPPDTSTGDLMDPLLVTDTTPASVTVPDGTPLYNPDGSDLVTKTGDGTFTSPYEVTDGRRTYRAFATTTKGALTLMMARKKDIHIATVSDPTPYTKADLDAEYNNALEDATDAVAAVPKR